MGRPFVGTALGDSIPRKGLEVGQHGLQQRPLQRPEGQWSHHGLSGGRGLVRVVGIGERGGTVEPPPPTSMGSCPARTPGRQLEHPFEESVWSRYLTNRARTWIADITAGAGAHASVRRPHIAPAP